MAANLNKEQRADFEREAWRLRRRGWTEARIAGELGVSQPTVSAMLRRVEKRFSEQFAKEVLQLKARQTAQLDHNYEDLMDQWERSKADSETRQQVAGRTHITREGDLIELPEQVTLTVSGQTGNPALMAQARGVLADQRAIWGADAPQKVAPTTPDGEQPYKSLVGIDIERV